MKRRLHPALLAALLLPAAAALPAPAMAQAAKTEASTADYNMVLKLEEGLWAAWGKKLQAVDAAPYYSKDPNTLHFDLSPLKFTGWAEYESTAMAGIGNTTGTAKVTIADDFKVIKGGNDVLIALFTWHVVFNGADGKPRGAGSLGRETDVWAREEDGKWRIIHQHLSHAGGPRDPAPVIPTAAHAR